MSVLTTVVSAAGEGAASSPAITTDKITEATGTIFTVVGQVLDQITANPVFFTFFIIGLVYTAARIISRLKRV